MPADERCPNTILFLLQSTSEGEEDSGLTLVDKLFLACEQNGMHDNFCDIYWYIKDTDEFVPAVIRLISVFQFYGMLFPNPVISNDGKTFLYYPKTKTSSIYEIPSSVTKINAHSFAGNPYIKTVKIPVVLEGRIWTPEEVDRAFELGAHCVVIGSAITRPQLITKRFVQRKEK